MNQYRKLCNDVRTAARSDKENWLKKQCQGIERSSLGNNIHKMYKVIKELNRNWQPKQKVIKTRDGRLLTMTKEISQRRTEYCKEPFAKTGDYGEKAKELISISPPSNTFNDRSLFSEVEEALRKMKLGKSPGIDQISAEIILAGKEILQGELYEIFNLAWEAEVIPEEWKKSILVAIPKKGDQSESTELCH